MNWEAFMLVGEATLFSQLLCGEDFIQFFGSNISLHSYK